MSSPSRMLTSPELLGRTWPRPNGLSHRRHAKYAMRLPRSLTERFPVCRPSCWVFDFRLHVTSSLIVHLECSTKKMCLYALEFRCYPICRLTYGRVILPPPPHPSQPERVLNSISLQVEFWVFGGIQLHPVQNLTSYSCSATPISYQGDEISRLSSLVIEIPILGYLGCFGGVLGGIQLLPVQNLTSYSCSATPISYQGDQISRLSSLVIDIPILGYLGCFGCVLGVFSYFRCKI